MGDVDRKRLKVALGRHYAFQREHAEAATIEALAQAMVAEDDRNRWPVNRSLGLAAFVWAQVRYVPAWTWLAQAALVALMWAVALAAGNLTMTKVTVGILSATTVMVGIPTVHASKRHRMAELEYACPNNAASVMVARLVILGCSSSLAVALMVGATAASLDTGVFCVALWSVPPFFSSCAGSLLALRKAAPSVAPVCCLAWTATCSATLLTLASALPHMYASASLAVWAIAAGTALAWLAAEVARTCQEVVAGLDAFSPHLARTYN